MPKRVNFKHCVLVYRCRHGLSPEYFSEDFKLVSEIHSRQRLRSISRPPSAFRAFPVAGARAWNAYCHLRAVSLLIPATSENFSLPATTARITVITVSWSWSDCTRHHVNPCELN